MKSIRCMPASTNQLKNSKTQPFTQRQQLRATQGWWFDSHRQPAAGGPTQRALYSECCGGNIIYVQVDRFSDCAVTASGSPTRTCAGWAPKGGYAFGGGLKANCGPASKSAAKLP